MKTRQETTELNVPIDEFISRVRDKINKYNKDNWDTIASLPPHFEYDKIKIDDNKLIIQKSIKAIDHGSPYIGVSGTIESDIVKSDNKTILQTKIYLDTAIGQFIKYTITAGLIIISLTLFLVRADYRIIIGLIASGTLVFIIMTTVERNNLDTLTTYYKEIINEMTGEQNAR